MNPEETMADPAPKQPEATRIKAEFMLKAGAKAALLRYCSFMDTPMTKFIEKRAMDYEKRCLARLTEDQREGYFDGSLTFDDLTEEERHQFTAPAMPIVEGSTKDQLHRLSRITLRTKSELVEILVRNYEAACIRYMDEPTRQRYFAGQIGFDDFRALRERSKTGAPAAEAVS
jgi:hypothetical protein